MTSLGLFALGTSPPPAARHRQSFRHQTPMDGGALATFERAHAIPPTSQITLEQVEPAAAAAAAAQRAAPRAADGDDASHLADVSAHLTFKAFFTEDVPRTSGVTSDGASRVRHVVLRFYPSDGSLAMAEEDARNDGLACGGKFALRRSRVPGVDAAAVRVGGVLLVAARTFTVYWCDEHTRRALAAADGGGAPQAPNFAPPRDAFAAKLAAEAAEAAQWHGHKPSGMARFVEAAKRGSPKPLRREHEAAPPLRFLLRWLPGGAEGGAAGGGGGDAPPLPAAAPDPAVARQSAQRLKTDPGAPQSTAHMYWLTFDLPSGELDVICAKGGCKGGGVKALVKRGRLPKAPVSMGPSEIGALSVHAGADDGAHPVVYVTEDDLLVGGTIAVSGRLMEVLDCDAATADWYAAQRGCDQRAARVAPESLAPPPPPPTRKPEPLMPRSHRPDRLTADPTGRASRFSARLVATNLIDAERVFVIQVSHDPGNAVSVQEHSMRNSGVVGGAFLKRQETPYALAHFAPGAEVVLKGHRLTIVGEVTASAKGDALA